MRKFQHRKDSWPRRLLLALILFFPCLCVFSLFAVLKRALEPHIDTSGTPRLHILPEDSSPPLVSVPPLSAKWATTPPALDSTLRHFSLDLAGQERRTSVSPHHDATDYAQQLLRAWPIGPRSLTAILPVTSQSLSQLESTISLLHQDPGALTEIVVLAYEPILSLTRRALRTIMTTISPNPDVLFPIEITLRTWKPMLTQAEASLRCMTYSSGSADWVLVLDQHYLEEAGEEMRSMLMNPPNVSFPLGMKGSGTGEREVLSFAGLRGFEVEPGKEEINREDSSDSKGPHPVSFVVPPFVLPTRLLGDNKVRTTTIDSGNGDAHLGSWAAFGHWISSTRTDRIGGVTLGYGNPQNAKLGHRSQHEKDFTGDQSTRTSPAQASHSQTHLPGVFGMLMFSPDDLLRFAPVVCKLVNDGHRVDVLLFGQSKGQRRDMAHDIDAGSRMFVDGTVSATDRCDIRYRSVVAQDSPPYMTVAGWFDGFEGSPDVLVASGEDSVVGDILNMQLKERRWDKATTLIRLPRDDLPYSDWMGTLTLEEWKSESRSLIPSDFIVDLHHFQTGTSPTSTLASSPTAAQLPLGACSILSKMHATSGTNLDYESTSRTPRTRRRSVWSIGLSGLEAQGMSSYIIGWSMVDCCLLWWSRGILRRTIRMDCCSRMMSSYLLCFMHGRK